MKKINVKDENNKTYSELYLLKKSCFFTVFLFCLISFLGCYKETAIPVKASFSTSFIEGDESVPVQIAITNQSTGADTFAWIFEGAEPSESSDENPGTLLYNNAGTYTIKLTVSNIDGSIDSVEKQITVVDGIAIDFSTEILENNYAPVEVDITNTTDGVGLSYYWTFEGGNPPNTKEKNPSNVFFENPGEHLITLEVSNGFESFFKTDTITVAPNIHANFDWKVDFFDDDYQAPVTLKMLNKSTSANQYRWIFPSGMPETSLEETPMVTFTTPGTYIIRLEVGNGKRTHEFSKEVTILPDTNIRNFNNVELAINSAHNTSIKGAFFSTSLRKVLTANEVTEENGGEIDVVFLGLNDSFSFNKFVSPDEAATNGFIAIPNATHTKFINSQEICNCSASMSVAEFDRISDDSLFQNLDIIETNNGLLAFDKSILPRIVLFETHDGRKGAIKVKDFISEGDMSYIICDIKVEKL